MGSLWRSIFLFSKTGLSGSSVFGPFQSKCALKQGGDDHPTPYQGLCRTSHGITKLLNRLEESVSQ